MASVNKWIGIGNLGRDPEVKYSANGTAVCSISVACTNSWKDKATGTKKEETEWVRVVMYDKLAEIAGKYLQKGRAVYIEGRLKTRKWQDKTTGADRYATEVIADQMQMLGPKGSEEQPQAAPQPAAPQRNQYAEARAGTTPTSGAAGLIEMENDIPF